MSFASATAVSPGRGSSYEGRVEPGWDIFGAANGGYTMAIAARAMAEETRGRELVSITGYFTNPARPGPVTVDVAPVKVGSEFSTFRASMAAGERAIVTVLAAFADADRDVSDSEIVNAPLPDVPTPGECVRAIASPDAPLPPPFVNEVEVLLHPEDAGALMGDRTGIARIRGWFRLRESEPADPLAVVLASDAFPPAVFNSNLPLKWTPTLDLTVHIRDPRPRTWFQCEFRTRFVTGGLLEEDGVLWDEHGNLIAQSRQLALVPR